MMAAGGSTGKVVGLGAVFVAVVGAVIWWVGQGAKAPEPVPEPAAVVSAEEPAPAVTETAAPEATAASPALQSEPPRFDVVRVDAMGLATIAGTAPPEAAVSLRLDGAEVAQAMADKTGQFAALVTLAPSPAPRLMTLVAILPDGVEVAGVETVAIGPVAAPSASAASTTGPETTESGTTESGTTDSGTPAADAPDPLPQSSEGAPEVGAESPGVELAQPQALLLSDAGATVLQPAAPAEDAPQAPISIDSISYGPAGEVMLSGRAGAGASLRIYLDDQPQTDVQAGEDGRWQVNLAEVAPGLHALRADQIDGAGKVLARFETPFQREVPLAAVVAPATPEPSATEPAPVAAPAPVTITVQPGLTLWAIARENFGDGVMYVQVFEANRDKIKDPDLIYPGQVFTVPKP